MPGRLKVVKLEVDHSLSIFILPIPEAWSNQIPSQSPEPATVPNTVAPQQ